MKYTPYYRIAENADTAVLFVHGIVGTPAHFKDLLPVIPEHWSVYNILLDGHGKTVEDFARTSMEKWRRQVAGQVDAILATHRQLYIVAHSMGTLFAIDEAIRQPERIRGLFLLAVPLTPRVRPSAAVNSVRVALGRVQGHPGAAEMLGDCGVHLTPALWKYLRWIPRFWELLLAARKTRGRLSAVSVPCVAFQSARDELVSSRAHRLLRNCPNIQVGLLRRSGHFAYSPEDLSLLQIALRELIQ